jgi:nucleoside-diphosphate-sugar epimerase
MKFTPSELVQEIQKHFPNFSTTYEPEEVKQYIANSWPQEFVDEKARKDWGWTPRFGLSEMVEDIVKNMTPEIVKQMRPK